MGYSVRPDYVFLGWKWFCLVVRLFICELQYMFK